MAIAYVNDTAQFSGGTNPTVLSPPTGTTAGNFLVGTLFTNTVISGLTIGSGWIIVAQFDTVGLGSSFIVYKPNCAASESDATVSYSGGAVTMFSHSAEFSGLAAAAAVDQYGYATTTTSPDTATASGADTTSPSLIYVWGEAQFSKSQTSTTSHTLNNGATATTMQTDDGSSLNIHRRTAYGVTTGNASADQDQWATSSMNLTSLRAMFASFHDPVAAAALVLEQGFVNFNDPGVYMQADEPRGIRRAWHRRHSGIFVPEYAI